VKISLVWIRTHTFRLQIDKVDVGTCFLHAFADFSDLDVSERSKLACLHWCIQDRDVFNFSFQTNLVDVENFCLMSFSRFWWHQTEQWEEYRCFSGTIYFNIFFVLTLLWLFLAGLYSLFWNLQTRGHIFSHVRPFYEQAVSNLDRSMHRSLWV
jgi:hypothetical protein